MKFLQPFQSGLKGFIFKNRKPFQSGLKGFIFKNRKGSQLCSVTPLSILKKFFILFVFN